jgi:hypothetical protein
MIKKYQYEVREYDVQIGVLAKILTKRRDEGWAPISVSQTNSGTFLVTYESWWKVKR